MQAQSILLFAKARRSVHVQANIHAVGELVDYTEMWLKGAAMRGILQDEV